jgi:ApaG protein
MYESMTRNIRVTVRPKYLHSQSRPDDDHFVWAYTITIENRGAETVTLRSRHWKITDARGRLQEVKGEGVVGEQPTLVPGESFEYTSGVPLSTPSGFMVGTYQMETAHGVGFDIDIPAFSLDVELPSHSRDSAHSHRLIN